MNPSTVGRYFRGETKDGEAHEGFLSCYMDHPEDGFAVLTLPGKRGEYVTFASLAPVDPPQEVAAAYLSPEELARIRYKIRLASTYSGRRGRQALLELEQAIDAFLQEVL